MEDRISQILVWKEMVSNGHLGYLIYFKDFLPALTNSTKLTFRTADRRVLGIQCKSTFFFEKLLSSFELSKVRANVIVWYGGLNRTEFHRLMCFNA